jgi:hypothetical protein
MIVHKKSGEQLYDWVHDPEELNNLAQTPEGQGTVQALKRQMQEQMSGSSASKSALASHTRR